LGWVSQAGFSSGGRAAGADGGGSAGQAKGKPAPGPSGGKWGWCTPAARVGTMVKGKSKAQGPGLPGQEVAANVWRGLRHPRMRDKGGTLTPFPSPGKIVRKWPPKQGSVAELGALWREVSPPRGRGRCGGQSDAARHPLITLTGAGMGQGEVYRGATQRRGRGDGRPTAPPPPRAEG